MRDRPVVVRRVHDSEDRRLAALSTLLQSTFADSNTVLELDRLQAFLAQPEGHRDRRFCVVVAEEGGLVMGGTVFSYVPATNCGFSEYLVVLKQRRGEGIGRLLFDARRAALDELARSAGSLAATGVFIEADNPQRTPPDLQIRERETAMDAAARLRLFSRLGFLRVEMDYVQPPLGPGKLPVSYLDLLFCPWDERIRQTGQVPAESVSGTLCPVWESWAPDQARTTCETLRQRLGASPVALVPLPA